MVAMITRVSLEPQPRVKWVAYLVAEDCGMTLCSDNMSQEDLGVMGEVEYWAWDEGGAGRKEGVGNGRQCISGGQ